jgi:NADPH:quinone reductase-like Zn-dependent oxidoreductase
MGGRSNSALLVFVATLAPDVKSFKIGDEVFGMAAGVGGLQGSLAEFVAVDANLLAHKPKNLTFRSALLESRWDLIVISGYL